MNECPTCIAMEGSRGGVWDRAGVLRRLYAPTLAYPYAVGEAYSGLSGSSWYTEKIIHENPTFFFRESGSDSGSDLKSKCRKKYIYFLGRYKIRYCKPSFYA